MPFYLLQLSYSATGIKNMVEHPQVREDPAREVIESLGGKMHSFHFAFGAYDVVVICEFPDNVSVGALSLAVSSAGTVSKFHTTPLITTAESVEIMKKAKAATYHPPT